MDENKVTISLKDYLEMYDKQQIADKNIRIIVDIILNSTRLQDDKKALKIETYNFKYGRIMDVIKESFPKEYEARLKSLQNDEEDED